MPANKIVLIFKLLKMFKVGQIFSLFRHGSLEKKH